MLLLLLLLVSVCVVEDDTFAEVYEKFANFFNHTLIQSICYKTFQHYSEINWACDLQPALQSLPRNNIQFSVSRRCWPLLIYFNKVLFLQFLKIKPVRWALEKCSLSVLVKTRQGPRHSVRFIEVSVLCGCPSWGIHLSF